MAYTLVILGFRGRRPWFFILFYFFDDSNVLSGMPSGQPPTSNFPKLEAVVRKSLHILPLQVG